MSGISSLSANVGTMGSSLSLTGSKKLTSREEIFAAQEAKEVQKAEKSQQTEAEFLKFARMSPAERLRAAYLKDHNLTEESLAKLPKEERLKIEAEIKQMIETKLGLDQNARTGRLADVSV